MTQVKEVASALGEVIDPELGIDIVDLGLIYGIEANASQIVVEMSATSEACPMTGVIQAAAQTRLEDAFPGVAVAVEMVMEPGWEPGMLGMAARKKLGLESGRVR